MPHLQLFPEEGWGVKYLLPNRDQSAEVLSPNLPPDEAHLRPGTAPSLPAQPPQMQSKPVHDKRNKRPI